MTAQPVSLGEVKNHPAIRHCFNGTKPTGWEVDMIHPDGVRWRRRSGGTARINATVIASTSRETDGRIWLHVSYSRPARMPTYEDLTYVKRHWIGGDQRAIMVLPDEAHHVNRHEYCLHLWCCLDPAGDGLPEFSRVINGRRDI